jgi:site-specific DNA-methyltransferase (adenine-specific)
MLATECALINTAKTPTTPTSQSDRQPDSHVEMNNDTILQGDCLTELAAYPNTHFDLICTSPPYAGKRSGVPVSEYNAWFLVRSAQFKRVLKPAGSFVLNIKEGAADGQRELYVMDLILALVRQQGWRLVDEYVWHKTNSAPGKWPNRFRDAWEHCYHFTQQKDFAMYQDAVMVPAGEWTTGLRLDRLNENQLVRRQSTSGSRLGRKVVNWVGREKAYPSNVLRFAVESTKREHDSAFPEALPAWFIKLFTKPGDTVLDPFCGSGTTPAAAKRLVRQYVGIDISPTNCELARKRIAGEQGQHLLWSNPATPSDTDPADASCLGDVSMARETGRIGGHTRAANLTPERRKEIAQLAAQRRWQRSA